LTKTYFRKLIKYPRGKTFEVQKRRVKHKICRSGDTLWKGISLMKAEVEKLHDAHVTVTKTNSLLNS